MMRRLAGYIGRIIPAALLLVGLARLAGVI